MKSLLVHGVYDPITLKTLQSLGVQEFAFDLRARSTNLIAFHTLKPILNDLSSSETLLIFENDLPTTVNSFLNLLKDSPVKIILEFRDNLPPVFYAGLEHDFYWMFHPDFSWKEILTLPHAKGVLLPLKYKSHYQELVELWQIIEARGLKIFLHASDLKEALLLSKNEGVQVSVDLSSEVERSYRSVDQEKLKQKMFWRNLNENIARQ